MSLRLKSLRLCGLNLGGSVAMSLSVSVADRKLTPRILSDDREAAQRRGWKWARSRTDREMKEAPSVTLRLCGLILCASAA